MWRKNDLMDRQLRRLRQCSGFQPWQLHSSQF